MTDFAKSARPTNATIAWAYKGELYVEFPTKDGPPYVTRFPLTTTGLSKALNVLVEHPATEGILASVHPSIKRAPQATDDMKAGAAEIVRRMFTLA